MKLELVVAENCCLTLHEHEILNKEQFELLKKSETEKINYVFNTGAYCVCLFQIFTPTERIENPLVINLVFCQIVQDVYSKACIRIGKDDRMRMKSFLGKWLL